jgi:hypothetical protein
VLAGVGFVPTAPAGVDFCARFGPAEVGGTVAEPRIVELSGLAASRLHPGVLWAHNDSGGAPELYAMGEDGTALGAYPVEGATATDWEDMASGPGPDGEGDFLYVGDIGDNAAARPSVTVYRVPEPDAAPAAPGEPLPGAVAIDLVYPAGPSDAEALLIDPASGDLVIVSKSVTGASRVLTADAAALVAGAPVTLVDRGGLQVPTPTVPGPGFPGTLVTGGDVSPDGSIVLLRTYQSVLAFPRADGQTVAEALLGQPCFALQAEEAQGEAVAFTGDGTAYVTMSEGPNVPVNRVELTTPEVTTTTTAATTTTQPPEPSDDADDDSSTAVILVVGAGVLVALGAAALVWSRRGRGSAG